LTTAVVILVAYLAIGLVLLTSDWEGIHDRMTTHEHDAFETMAGIVAVLAFGGVFAALWPLRVVVRLFNREDE
jgi:hypothetical protein